MRTYFILLFCFLYHVILSQTVCKGVVLDNTSGQPVEFANIGIIGKGIGTVSNEKGEYSFSVPDSVIDGSVRISMIGYKPMTFSVKELSNIREVKLPQSTTLLKEVSVDARPLKIKIAGNRTKTRMVSAGFKNNSLGSELGVRLSVSHTQTQIRKVMINVNANTLDTLPVFRFNVYKVDGGGLPGENLLTRNIIITPAEKTGYIEFDLRPYGIYVSEDVFITLEWIKDLGDAKGLYFSTRLAGNSTYFRQTSQDKWEKMNAVGVGLHAEVAY